MENAISWEHFHHELRDGFDIDVFFAREETDPADHFDDCCADAVEAIRDGRLEWFAVKVEASRHGVPLGEDYLGSCAYESASDFLLGGYYNDVVAEAIQAARETLARLREVAAVAKRAGI